MNPGAYTGEVSAGMLREFGVRYCLVGHSERRQYHGETDAVVATKAQRALAAGVLRRLCVLVKRWLSVRRDAPKKLSSASWLPLIHTNGHCISEIVVAYEPVWAIGTGKTATPEEAQQVHAVLRAQLACRYSRKPTVCTFCMAAA
jgi:triosephosphate isomerase